MVLTQSRASSLTTMTVIPYAETLLAKSQELISRGEYNIATVVAHMACEVAAEQALSRAFASKGLEYLDDAVTDFLIGYNIATKRIRNLYNALTGREIQKQPFWHAFKEVRDAPQCHYAQGGKCHERRGGTNVWSSG